MEHGYLKKEIANGILVFPELTAGESKFNFTYLHPGEYYVTAIADINKGNYLSKEDLSSKSLKVVVKEKSTFQMNLKGISTQN